MVSLQAWRVLTRSYMTADTPLLAYSPMFHSRLFATTPRYRAEHFEPLHAGLAPPGEIPAAPPSTLASCHLDGNPATDRPLFVQFCSNDPVHLLAAAQYVAPFCDAVDLNLGCPQGIARKGHYGAFLQEDWPLIHHLINTLHTQLRIPVTAKFRIQETREKTLAYARMILDAGASIITVHGRRREQKGHATGMADWDMIRYLRDNLPSDTVIFANGNILQHGDIQACLDATGADGVMSAEGNLYDPTIFAAPPQVGDEGREYWRGRDGRGGYRMDAVLRRYMDIMYEHVLGREPPSRPPLFVPSDLASVSAFGEDTRTSATCNEDLDGPPRKKQKTENMPKTTTKNRTSSPNLSVIQPHLFHMLRPLVSRHTEIRDALARARGGDIDAFEGVLQKVELVVRDGLLEYARDPGKIEREMANTIGAISGTSLQADDADPSASSIAALVRCKRPWWVCQPYVRPLPSEALQKGAMTLSKKAKSKLVGEMKSKELKDDADVLEAGLTPEGTTKEEKVDGVDAASHKRNELIELPKDGMVCG